MKVGKLLVWVVNFGLLGAAVFQCHAQPPNFQWADGSTGTGGSDQVEGMAIDRDGNILTTGIYQSTNMSFGGLTLISGRATNSPFDEFDGNFFLIKQDPLGHALWAVQSTTDISIGSGCATDPSGNIFVTGYYETPTFNLAGSVLTNNGQGDIFLAKLDPAGNLLWLRQAGGSGEDVVWSIAANSTGEVFIGGALLSSNAVFGASALTATNGNRNAFLAKYDGSGNVLWAREILGSELDSQVVAAGTNGDCRIVCDFTGTVTIGGQSLTNPVSGAGSFIASFDSSGTLVWAKQVGSGAGTAESALAVDSRGNSFVTGFFGAPQISFNGIILTNSGGFNLFLAKYDGGGNVLWAVASYATNAYYGSGPVRVALDATGNCYLSGALEAAKFDFGNGWILTNSLGIEDSFLNHKFGYVAKFSPNGIPLWAKAIRSVGLGIYLAGLATDREQNLICAGALNLGTCNFDGTTLTNNYQYHYAVFVARLNGPQLGINQVGSQLQLAWPTNALGLRLETATALQGAPWSPLTNAPAVSGQSQSVTLDLSPPAGFFRLSDGPVSP